MLEYYDGILILTSNRVGTFDEAFKSRVQVALHYEYLSRKSRKKIWNKFLDRIEDEDDDAEVDKIRKRIDELANHEMNGRQIRNAIGTARQLALYHKQPLDWSHMESAVQVGQDFNKYLLGLKGHSDEDYARDQNLRWG
jgi:MoxR-like ATPase